MQQGIMTPVVHVPGIEMQAVDQIHFTIYLFDRGVRIITKILVLSVIYEIFRSEMH